MPCRVSPMPPDPRDSEWRQCLNRHHRMIEKAFEDMIAEVAECNHFGTDAVKPYVRAKRRRARARKILADGYRKIWGPGMPKEHLEAKIKDLLGDKS